MPRFLVGITKRSSPMLVLRSPPERTHSCRRFAVAETERLVHVSHLSGAITFSAGGHRYGEPDAAAERRAAASAYHAL
ncbi:hypothetical protein [Microbacterium agarici]